MTIWLKKKLVLEPTKPLFNKHGILNLRNLYYYHIFMETFKVLKFGTPISVCNLISLLPQTDKLRLELPLVRLEITKQNFAFKATLIWNDLSGHVFEKCIPTESGLIIPGSSKDSDLGASTGTIKSKLKSHLLSQQKLGDALKW